ncbi:MAG: GNAT family N-acetyltransferase [Candidatus Delongbacteria bacterium]
MNHSTREPIPPAEVSEHYAHYLACCPAGDLPEILEEQRLRVLEELGGWDDEAGRLAYAPGKWSGAALLGHLADTEQVFFERALRAARGDSSPQPGFSEDAFAAAFEPLLSAQLERWHLQRRLIELEVARLEPAAWLRLSRVLDRHASVRALLRILVGHCEHHLTVWRERYRPLLPAGRRPPVAQLEQGLSLRQVDLADLDELLALSVANQERLGRWLGWAEPGIDPAGTRRFLVAAREAWLLRGLPNLALRLEDRLVGLIGLNPLEARSAHIGYWIAAGAEGRGHVRAAVRWLTAHAFDTLNLDRVEIRCALENRRSRAVPESLGFRLEGVLRGAQRLERGVQDLALYALAAADWPVLRAAWAAGGPERSPGGACRVLRAAEAEPVLEQAGLRGWRLGQDGERRFVSVRLEPGAVLAPHPVPDRALFWVAAGAGRLEVDGQSLELVAGDLALVEGGAARGWTGTGSVPLELRVVRGWPAA